MIDNDDNDYDDDNRAYLDVFAASDLSEMFLRLEGLVGAVVGGRRAHDTQHCFDQISALGEHKELTEERHSNQLSIQLGRHARHLGETLTVEQPEPVDQSQHKLPSRGQALLPLCARDLTQHEMKLKIKP